jgi:hypothetical protein
LAEHLRVTGRDLCELLQCKAVLDYEAVGPNTSSIFFRSVMSTSATLRQAEIGEAGHAVALLGHAARRDAGEVRP